MLGSNSQKLLENFFKSQLKLGIIAGGQLGKMLIQEASKWDITTYVMDTDERCPAGKIASYFVKGDLKDFDDVYRFGKLVDILTFEIESVNILALKKLKEEGLIVLPDPGVIELIQDKGLQKDFLKKNNIPTPDFKIFNSKDEIFQAIRSGQIKYPFVQKLRKGGYDGRGVFIIEKESDMKEIVDLPSVVEEKVEIKKEVAVIVARNEKGEIKNYPLVEMVFDPKANLLDKLICPANVSEKENKKAVEVATRVVEKLDVIGVLAIEFFIDKEGNVLVNEMAPRPHNSGHHTIESVQTSQFEQHLRAILGLPLGSTELIIPSVMVNILGEEGYVGEVRYEGIEKALSINGVKIHLYGKKITKPYRKMGHITILDKDINSAIEKADLIKKTIRVIS
ncbi:MAG: 5-(carboxyamino)imidazole ribonucleotide synthase [Proteobacteria bacterium]|nr:5-(carboxyamino)imidazole ribonucleotide synthase [Pseudomonadota bacterium]